MPQICSPCVTEEQNLTMSVNQPELSDLKRRLTTLASLSDQLENIRSAPFALFDRRTNLDTLPELTASLFQPTPTKDLRSTFQAIQSFSQQLQLDETKHAIAEQSSESGLDTQDIHDIQAWLGERLEKRSAPFLLMDNQ
jgi:hypothetical protein